MKNTGVVYLVGAGPGNPDLITKKGLDYLKKCDVVIYDRLISNALLNYVKEECIKIYVGKQAGNHYLKQDEINQLLIQQADKGKIVVRLKGGDPFIFGRGGEEALVLKQANIPYEIVPGITSAIAAASYAGIPLTYREISQSFHVMTGHTLNEKYKLPKDFSKMAKLEGTLVFLMGLGNLSFIAQELIKNGKTEDSPVAVIEKGTTIEQKIIKADLLHIAQKVEEANLESPAIIVIGEVVNFEITSTINRKLEKVKIGITGTLQFNEKLRKKLEDIGAYVEVVQSLIVQEYKYNKALDQALKQLKQYTWIVFTSANGVYLFFERMKREAIDFRALAFTKFAVIGGGTNKALSSYGFLADYMPEQFSTLDLANGLKKFLTQEDIVLIPRAEKGSKELIQILEEEKKRFEVIPLYKITRDLNGILGLNQVRKLDYLIFGSSSAVDFFFQELTPEEKKSLSKVKIVCIGEITAKQLKHYKIFNFIVAKEYSIEGLVNAISKDMKFSKRE